MGNGATKEWAPANVVTVVLAGGQTKKQYPGPMSVGELMTLYPRHRVVIPCSSPMIVSLGPEFVLRNGYIVFLLEKGEAVVKVLIKRVLSSSAEQLLPARRSIDHHGRNQTGAVQETGCTVDCPCSPKLGTKGSAGRSASTRSPTAGRSPRRGSPAGNRPTLRSPLRKEKGLRGRRWPSNPKDSRRESSLLYQMRKQDQRSRENLQAMDMESSESGDGRGRNTSDPSAVAARQAASMDLAVPEDESFKTPVMRSPEEEQEAFVSAEMSPDQDHQSSEAMDTESQERASNTLPTKTTATPPHGCASDACKTPEMMDLQGDGHRVRSESLSSRERAPMSLIGPPTVSDGGASSLSTVPDDDASTFETCQTKIKTFSEVKWKRNDRIVSIKIEPVSGKMAINPERLRFGHNSRLNGSESPVFCPPEPRPTPSIKGEPPPQQLGVVRHPFPSLNDLGGFQRGNKSVGKLRPSEVFKPRVPISGQPGDHRNNLQSSPQLLPAAGDVSRAPKVEPRPVKDTLGDLLQIEADAEVKDENKSARRDADYPESDNVIQSDTTMLPKDFVDPTPPMTSTEEIQIPFHLQLGGQFPCTGGKLGRKMRNLPMNRKSLSPVVEKYDQGALMNSFH